MKIFIIGSGNVAAQLGRAWKNAGHDITGVYSRNSMHAKKLSKVLKCSCTDDLNSISQLAADIFLIAVKDDAIESVVRQIPALGSKVVIHTSGATSLSVLRKKFMNCGVLWQAQSISSVNSSEKISFVIEASNAYSEKILRKLCSGISNVIYYFNSKQRKILHLSAVWVNNFPNHFYVLAEDLLRRHGLPFELLGPLILSTAKNGLKNPRAAQTGPAKRNDKKTMKAHLALLPSEYRKLYTLISKSIFSKHNKL